MSKVTKKRGGREGGYKRHVGVLRVLKMEAILERTLKEISQIKHINRRQRKSFLKL
jgi:hypothetical protein